MLTEARVPKKGYKDFDGQLSSTTEDICEKTSFDQIIIKIIIASEL